MNLIRLAKGPRKTEKNKASLYFRNRRGLKNTRINYGSMLILINKNEIEVA